MMSVPKELLEIMVCPACHGTLEERDAPPALACLRCGLHYPVRDGIPVMLEEDAYRPDGSGSEADSAEADEG